ncbi:MAG: DPP IV N-terminal domain-containing protein [Chitinophagaceae bacterium]|nr:DPP IV N-terminal domain-containing protein [Chitinophagaceae bacterium]
MRKFFLLFFLLPLVTMAQTKQITLEDIYKKGTFRGEFVRADFGTVKTDTEIKAADLKDENGKSIGEPEDIIRTDANPNTVLIRKDIERIYRRSSKAVVYLFDIASKKLIKLEDDKVIHPTFSPDGTKIAYVKTTILFFTISPAKHLKQLQLMENGIKSSMVIVIGYMKKNLNLHKLTTGVLREISSLIINLMKAR